MPRGRGYPPAPNAERFWPMVIKGPGCWLWTGARHKKTGYGIFGQCFGSKKWRTVQAHRFAYEDIRGVLDPGVCVLHRCDVRTCVRPDHMFLGTRADNVADMVAKGRQAAPRKEKHWKAKLTAAQVEQIRARLRNGDRQIDVAASFGVGQTAISKIGRGELWK